MTATAPREERATPAKLRSFARAVLGKIGMPEADASTGAEAMVWSDLRGAPTQGVTGRLVSAVARVRAGGVKPSVPWTVLRESASFALLDAGGAWGQVAGTRGMRAAVEKARATGVGVTVVRNADTTAAMGWYPTVAIAHRMIGLTINNTMPLMAAAGGTQKIIGNQAFAIGVPAGAHHPILFDSALAQMSNSGINVLKGKGEQLPPGVALDASGRPTLDPAAALAGIMLPMGGHRGYGLALCWEVLTGVLAGARMTPDIGGPTPEDKPMGLSLFCLAIDPTVALPYEQFVSRVDALIDQMHASPVAAGAERVRVPGERGFEIAARYEREGVPVPPERAARLRQLAEELGVRWDTEEVRR